MFHLVDQDVLHEAGTHGVDAFEGFVHEEEFGFVDEAGGHGNPFSHSFGIFGDELFAFVREFEEFKEFGGAGFGEGLGEGVHAADEFEELLAREAVEEEGFVGDEADALFDFYFAGGHGEAQEFDGAGVGADEAGEHADGGGFAGAVGAEEAEEGASWDGEGEAVDGGFAVIFLAKIPDLDGRGGIGHLLSLTRWVGWGSGVSIARKRRLL